MSMLANTAMLKVRISTTISNLNFATILFSGFRGSIRVYIGFCLEMAVVLVMLLAWCGKIFKE